MADSIAFLNPQPDELVLDLGCGEGKECLALAQMNLSVIAVDLSRTQLQRARRFILEQYPDANVHFVQANAEELPFVDQSFRIAYGKAILHHLDVAIAARELNRLLQSEGLASFAEPMANHPIIWLGRRLTPKLRTPDEHPLQFTELRRFGQTFAHVEINEYFLLVPLAYVFRLLPRTEALFRWYHKLLQRIDRLVFRFLPLFRNLAWYGQINVRKKK